MLACCIAHMDKQKKIELDIYEATAELEEIGAGIILSQRTFEIMVKIGLEEDILKYCEREDVDSCSFPLSDVSTLWLSTANQPLPSTIGKATRRMVIQSSKFSLKVRQLMFFLVGYRLIRSGGITRIHRADLQRVLLKSALTHSRLHLASKLVSYAEHPDNVSLEFMDGSKRTCDLLVGADGIKSTVRRIFLASRPGQESIEPVWTGSYAYRGRIPRNALLKMMPGHRVTRVPLIQYVGKLKVEFTLTFRN